MVRRQLPVQCPILNEPHANCNTILSIKYVKEMLNLHTNTTHTH